MSFDKEVIFKDSLETDPLSMRHSFRTIILKKLLCKEILFATEGITI